METVTNEDIIKAWSDASAHVTSFGEEGDVAERIGNDRDLHVPSSIVIAATRQ